MAVLVTGASGFLGSALVARLLAKGNRVYALSRHPPAEAKNLIPLVGDIMQVNLGLEKAPGDISAVYHLAGIHRLGEDKDGSIWNTNVMGTNNVLAFCLRYDIPHLLFTSTAYTWECNSYGLSKITNEKDISIFAEGNGLKVTIFKPSIVMGTEEQAYAGHFLQFVKFVLKLHEEVDLADRVACPLFRVPGDPEAALNLIKVSDVAAAMAEIEREGVFWLTHPRPRKLAELTEWISEIILVDIRVERDFEPTPLEAVFQRKGAGFLPYLWGDNFHSDIKAEPINKLFIQDAIRAFLSTS